MLRRVHAAFGRALPVVAWVELVGGLTACVLTACGVIPPFGDTVWTRLVTCIGWLLLAQEGFHELGEEA